MGGDGARDIARAALDLAARLPEPLAPLALLAHNYLWSWTPGGTDLFRSMDPVRFDRARENPLRLLQELPASILNRLAADEGFVSRVNALELRLREELERPAHPEAPEGGPVAFLCAEFGIHPSLPIYAGGLGVLAGDLLKEASDQGLPMVGVGLLYSEGYFHQRLDRTGWQHEHWTDVEAERLPAALVTGDDDLPLLISVPIRGREVVAQVWRVDVGRVPLYLLDAQRPENRLLERWITARLYIGDPAIRLAQYALLGIGGMRALAAMGIEPSVVHLNEGHAAMAPLEVARVRLEQGASFEEALEEGRRRTIFTTHTPVPAGNETFDEKQVMEALGDAVHDLRADRVLALGRPHPGEEGSGFGITTLGLRLSRRANGVSRRHGQVAREMWQQVFGVAADEVPIGHVTNGVHLPTWLGPPMRQVLDRHLTPGWERRTADPSTWEPVEAIPDEELWAARAKMRGELIRYVRTKSAQDLLGRGAREEEVREALEGFDSAVLTLGFARRVAAYKRLSLLILDAERALRILAGPPAIQLVLAGKAHPKDQEAKSILQGLFRLGTGEEVTGGVAYLEDYDMAIAARLVRGCDVWVNLPRRPMEASGTSGMKAALNGGLNCSVLDGWWEEAYEADASIGWAVEGGRGDTDEDQDALDASAFYDVVEREILPLWNERDERGVPRGWVRRIKSSLRTIGPRFTATRPLGEYIRESYGP